ncbi:hypothetical protein PRZ48_007323 [Zasmidium cellare]|uniref:Zn(2)-C6 fungal-type domain-containing protein n=1 Tax=Zasmidium cellare TaxID=395010 RepID=A0ABR0EJ08_ZASCE|nr:hypothetical protein PRZ48_007323 [Zasmidium cellare]
MDPDADSQPSVPSASDRANGKPRRFACVRCRQSKVLPDLGQPCRRCAAQGFICDYDADYKRVSKKRKIQELVNEVQLLRATVGNNASPAPGPSPSRISAQIPDHGHVDSVQHRYGSPQHLPNDLAEHLPSPILTTSSSNVPPVWEQENYSAPHSRTLGNVAISGTESLRLFTKFFEKPHSFAELQDPSDSPDHTYAQSPLLFWAIIAVASRHDSLNSTLQVTLAPAVTELLWTTFSRPPYSVADIQGMLLLCLWPFPAPSLSSDSRFPLVAATRSAAMQIGLHSLDHLRDFSHLKLGARNIDRLKAAKTWAACVVAVESVTGFIGQPSVIRDEVTSDQMMGLASETRLPPQLDHLFRIFMFSNRVHRIMTSVGREAGDTHSERAVILRLMERDFKTLWTALDDRITAKARVMLAFAGLQMRVYYFFEKRSAPGRRLGILRAYQLALLLVDLLKEVDGSTGLLRYAPVIYQDATIFSSIFLLKVIKSSYSEDIDIAAGHSALDICMVKLRECVSTTGDYRFKVHKMLSQLRTMDYASRDAGDNEPHLKLRTRLSGSLVHDFLWMWREEFGGQISKRASPAREFDLAVGAGADFQHFSNPAQPDLTQEYPTPQYPALSGSDYTESNEDYLFAEIFGSGGLDPSSLASQRADVDWFYQADSLGLS